MYLITLRKVWETTKTIAEKQYELCSRCDDAIFHVRGDNIQNSSFHYFGMSGNGAVESMGQHGEVCRRYEIDLLGTIGVHDMKTFDPFRTIPRS